MERICQRDLCHLGESEGKSDPAKARVEREGEGAEVDCVAVIHLLETRSQIIVARSHLRNMCSMVSGCPQAQLWGMALELHFRAVSPVKRELLETSQQMSLYFAGTVAFQWLLKVDFQLTGGSMPR